MHQITMQKTMADDAVVRLVIFNLKRNKHILGHQARRLKCPIANDRSGYHNQ
jgi:hypothetical protein